MKEALLQAYLDTTYRVFFGDEHVDIRTGMKHKRLDELLEGRSWAFVSATNPGSVLCSDNERRHALLLERLKPFRIFRGIGIPDRGSWPPEESVLVCGITEHEAATLAGEFGQNAFLFGENGHRARLVLAS